MRVHQSTVSLIDRSNKQVVNQTKKKKQLIPIKLSQIFFSKSYKPIFLELYKKWITNINRWKEKKIKLEKFQRIVHQEKQISML